MKPNLWNDCLTCNEKCCSWDIAFPLFTTEQEREKLPKINSTHPCYYLTEKKLCAAHKNRPFDCRLFPFEIMHKNGDFFWIYWDVNCSIIKNRKNDFEKFLQEHEKNIIPNIFKHLKDYAEFRFDEINTKYNYTIIRKVNIPKLTTVKKVLEEVNY